MFFLIPPPRHKNELIHSITGEIFLIGISDNLSEENHWQS